MDIKSLYTIFVEAGQRPCGRNDPHRAENLQRYRTTKQQLFEALKADYLAGKLHSDRADNLVRVISESAQNPEAFWGSSKTASANQAIFAHEKSERLFEVLLCCWKEKEGEK